MDKRSVHPAPGAKKPARCDVGGEHNAILKDKAAVDTASLSRFPDTYEIGMSNLVCVSSTA